MSIFIKSPINYSGNKYKLLGHIINLFPTDINTFVDVFGGSGTVCLNVIANNHIYNDFNKSVEEVFEGLLTNNEECITNIKKIINEYGLSKTNEEGFYRLRNDFNNGLNDWLHHYVLMCYSFNGQSRYNSKGEYNSSFGKNRSCFSKNQENNISKMKTNIKDILCISKSFKDIDYSVFTKNDLIYLDPPYLGSDAVYNEKGGWNEEMEKSLYEVILDIDRFGIKFALSNNMKYNNPYLQKLSNKFVTHHLGSNYTNCSYHKKDRSEDDEVLITNY